MGGHLFGHVQGHVTGVFRPYPLPTGTVAIDIHPEDIIWGDGTFVWWSDGSGVEWSNP